MAEQTLSSGRPLPQARWGNLGMFPQVGGYPLGKCHGMIVGEQNSGKSWLVQGSPEIFVMNMDLSSIVTPHAKCGIWPHPDPETGLVLDHRGKPFQLTWNHVLEKITELERMALSNEERPVTVAFDTINAVIKLLKPWVAKEMDKKKFVDVHGQIGWPMIYEEIENVYTRLRAVGYGVLWLAHLTRDWIKLEDQTNVQSWSLSLPDGLRDRLCKTVEVIMPLVSSASTESIPTSNPIKDSRGNVITTLTNMETKTVYTRKLAFSDSRFLGITRVRTPRPMPDLDITHVPDAWARVCQAYREANRPEE